MTRARLLGAAIVTASVGYAVVAPTDEVGVPAKVVKALDKPGKALIKVVWKDPSGSIDKGSAGDPTLLQGDFELCLAEEPDGTGGRRPVNLQTQDPWTVNTDKVAKYKSYDFPLRTVVVKQGTSAKVVAKSDQGVGLASVSPWPPHGGYVTLQVSNGNDSSSHRLCANLAGAESVIAKDIAGGAGRKITWKGVPADPNCDLFNFVRVSAGCSPSGAFLD